MPSDARTVPALLAALSQRRGGVGPRVMLASERDETLALQWQNADLLEAAIPISGRETVLNTVEITGQKPVSLPPVCLPYSPEFAPDQPGRGAAALTQIATTTGGKLNRWVTSL